MFLYGPKVVFKRGTKSCESDSAIKRFNQFLIVAQQVYRLINNELNPDFKVLTLVYMILLSLEIPSVNHPIL
jgi:hypothetical protein